MLDKKLIDTSTDLIADSIDTVIAPFDFGIPVVTLIKDSIVLGKNIYDRRLLKKLLAFFDNAKYQTARNKIKMDAFFEKHMSRKTKLFQKMMYSRNHEEIDYRAVQLLTMSDRVQHCFETVSLYPTRYSCLFRRYFKSGIRRNCRAHCSTPARAIG